MAFVQRRSYGMVPDYHVLVKRYLQPKILCPTCQLFEFYFFSLELEFKLLPYWGHVCRVTEMKASKPKDYCLFVSIAAYLLDRTNVQF